MNIVMVAAENDALAGGKVGGIGDVVRDIPRALAEAGHTVQVVTPGYGAFSRSPGSARIATLSVSYRGNIEQVELFRVVGRNPQENVPLWVLEHPLFATGGAGRIYCDDPGDRPFATDASKFALFCIAVAQALVEGAFEESASIDVLHLHDWHAALVSVLCAFDPAYTELQSLHTVYSIHNLALQGTRPLDHDESSLAAWYPGLVYEPEQLNDPRAPHCINPMRAGINLSDRVHAVSPTYAEEIQRPSQPSEGFFGGEGLHEDLRRAAADNRLYGVLNGCEYPEEASPSLAYPDLLLLCENELLKWVGKHPMVESAHLIASRRLAHRISTAATRPPTIVTSVGRITDQKMLLLRQPMQDGRSALDHLLARLGDDGLLILLGSGDAELEQFLTRTAGEHENLIFLKGYSEAISQGLYSSGDLFLMPSSFEPCGISQMLAMRAGQPCLVHAVGGLRDTVLDGENGFAFEGEGLTSQAAAMLATLERALELKHTSPKQWRKIANSASEARFLWSTVAAEVLQRLYRRE